MLVQQTSLLNFFPKAAATTSTAMPPQAKVDARRNSSRGIPASLIDDEDDDSDGGAPAPAPPRGKAVASTKRPASRRTKSDESSETGGNDASPGPTSPVARRTRRVVCSRDCIFSPDRAWNLSQAVKSYSESEEEEEDKEEEEEDEGSAYDDEDN